MPEPSTIAKARRDAAEGKAPSTQAGEFVREEIHKVREGQHGVRSPEQAIAIGLSMARRAGVKLPPPQRGKTSPETRRKAQQDLKRASRRQKPSPRRSRARVRTLKREPTGTVSHRALSAHAKKVARRRTSG